MTIILTDEMKQFLTKLNQTSINNPFFERSLSTVNIKFFKSGMWQITFEAHIILVLLIKFFIVLIFSVLKKLFIVCLKKRVVIKLKVIKITI